MSSLIPCLLIVLTDQISKYLIRVNFSLFESREILSTYLKFTYIENPGLAFGLSVGSLSWLLFIVTLAIAIYIGVTLFWFDMTRYERISLVFILGGAIGNLIDRGFTLFGVFGYNGVIDFIDIGVFDHSLRWYIFNIADVSVSIGIGYYLLYSYLTQKADRFKNEAA